MLLLLVKKFSTFTFYGTQGSTVHSILSQMRPAHNSHNFPKAHDYSFFASKSRSSEWSLLLRFPTKILYTLLTSPTRAICPAHHILLESI